MHERLFPPLASFWGGENLGPSARISSVGSRGDILAFALQEDSRAWLWVRDSREAYNTGFGPAAREGRLTEGATVSLSGLLPDTYVVSLHETVDDGDIAAEFTAAPAQDRLDIQLPPFAGDIALKVSAGTGRNWGIVPRTARAWTTTDAGDGVRTGYVHLQPSAGSPPAAAGALLTLAPDGIPTSDLMVPAVPAVRIFWTVAEIGAPSEVGLAIANPVTIRASIELLLHDSQGRLHHTSSLDLAPGAHTARFLYQLFPSVPGSFQGTLLLKSGTPVGALALRGTKNHRGEFALTTLPGRYENDAEIRETVVLAQVADGGGYRTEWLFLNPYDTEIAGKMRVYLSDGNPWSIEIDGGSGAESEYRIAPHGLVRRVSSGGSSQIGTGYSTLTPEVGPAPVTAAVIHSSSDGLISQAGVPFQRMAESGFAYWESEMDTYTGTAFANASGQTRRIKLELHARGGIERVLQTEIELAPGHHTARLLTELFPGLPEKTRGVLYYDADGPVGFLALRLRATPRGEHLMSSLSLGDVSDRTPWLLPQFASGGGYSTRIVLVNSGHTTAEGQMLFRDSEGCPARLLFVTR